MKSILKKIKEHRSQTRKLEDESNKNQDREIFVNSKIELPIPNEAPISNGEFSDPTEDHIHTILSRYFLWL